MFDKTEICSVREHFHNGNFGKWRFFFLNNAVIRQKIRERFQGICSRGVFLKRSLDNTRFHLVRFDILSFVLFTYPKGASVSHSPRRIFWRIPRFTFSTRLSEKYLLCPNATCNMNLPCGVGSNQNCGKRKEAILLMSTRYMIFPPSTELRARRSGCHAKIPSASSELSIYSIILANWSRPGFFALFASVNTFTISMRSLLAYSRNSKSCASMDIICWSSSSVLLRA